jgi:hypothetical protein
MQENGSGTARWIRIRCSLFLLRAREHDVDMCRRRSARPDDNPPRWLVISARLTALVTDFLSYDPSPNRQLTVHAGLLDPRTTSTGSCQ